MLAYKWRVLTPDTSNPSLCPPHSPTPPPVVQFRSQGYYPVGTSTVLYTATDADGNTATCSFDITVNSNGWTQSSYRSAVATGSSASSLPL